MLVVSVSLVDQTFCKVTFLENAINITVFLSIDQISNTDDLQKKSEQILPYQLVFTCCLGVFFTCKYEVLFDLIKKHIVIVDSP